MHKHLAGHHDQKKHGREGPNTSYNYAQLYDPSQWHGDLTPERLARLDAQVNAGESINEVVSSRVSPAGEWPEDKDASAAVISRVASLAASGVIPQDSVEPMRIHLTSLVEALHGSSVNGKKIPASDIRELSLRATDAIAAQENESLGRQLGDHGAHHIAGNINIALSALSVMGTTNDTPKARAAVMIACMFHDTGYLTAPSQNFQDKPHPHWSAQYYEKQIAPMIAKTLGKEESEYIGKVIATHDSSDVDWANNPVASAVRLADNVAIFHKEKLPGLFRLIPENLAILREISGAEVTDEQVVDVQKRMVANVKATTLPVRIKQRLVHAVGEVSKRTPEFTLGMLSGGIKSIEWNEEEKAVQINLIKDERVSSMLNRLRIDLGQSQFMKFARKYGLDPNTFATPSGTSEEISFVTDAKETDLVISIQRVTKSLARIIESVYKHLKGKRSYADVCV